MAPDSIGRYQLIEEIGRGGMATVYRAHDPRFKRDVAIKLMTRDLLQDKTLKARFEREAQTIAALEHPAIVPVYDFGEEDGRPYLVMRLMNASTLDHRLEQGHLSVAETSAILNRIGSALERAHERGVIHRDLKPSNIMFDDYGDAFLADFGIARLTESSVTLTGDSVIGTPAYMSPEQIHGDKGIDGRSDIYALGVICFEMLTGERPYTDTTPAKVMMRHIMDPVPDIRAVKPDLPPGVELVIANTMAKDPDERYQTPHEMTDTLSALSEIGETATPAVAPPDQAEKTASPGTEPADPKAKSTAAGAAALAAPRAESEETPAKITQAPSVDDEEFPVTEVVVPSFVAEETPQTEIAVPSFVGQEPAPQEPAPHKVKPRAEPGAPEDDRGPNWLLLGIGAVIVIVAVGAVIGGGFFLFSQMSGDDEDSQSSAAAASQVEVQPTSRPAESVPTQVEPATEKTPVDEPVEERNEASRILQSEEQWDRFYQSMGNENWDEAIAALDQANVLMPNEQRYLLEKAFLLNRMDEPDEALELINQAIVIDPNAAENYETRALILWNLGDIEASLDDGLHAVELGSKSDAIHRHLGDIYFEFGDLESALEEYNVAIDLNPNVADHYAARAAALEYLGDFGAAADNLTTAIDLDPEATWILDQFGNIVLWGLGDARSAVEIFGELVKREPGNAWHYLNRGIAKRELGDIEGSLTDIGSAIELEPGETDFYAELGWTHYAAGRVDDAIASFSQAIEIDPSDPDSYYQRANFFYYDLEDLSAALEDYTRAIELDPGAGWQYLERSLVYRELGDIDSALADLETGIALDPEDSGLYLEKGNLYADLGDYDAALHEYDRAIEVDPFNPSNYEHKAVLLGWDIGDLDAALATFERCLEVDPGFPWCPYNMGWLFDDFGDIGAAVESLGLFIELVDPAECPECVEEAQEYIDINS